MDAAAVRFLNAGVGAFPPFDRLMEAFASDYLVPVAGSLVSVRLPALSTASMTIV